MTFLMSQGLKRRNTHAFEGSSMAVGGEGGAGSGNPVEQRFGKQKWGFTKVLVTFQEGGGVQARKELTLSVLRR